MLTTLPTLKSRLSILPTDTTYDSLLTTAIKAISARFDKETNRTLARTENASFGSPPLRAKPAKLQKPQRGEML